MPYRKLLWSAILLAAANSSYSADLRVTIEGPIQADAPVYLALYDDPDAFENGKEGIRLAVVNRWWKQPSVAFTDLPQGRYVVAVFQDLNGNGELDSNLVGAPAEPYALSGDVENAKRPPRFDDAAIEIQPDTHKSIKLELRQ